MSKKINRKTLVEVFFIHGFTCAYCGLKTKDITLDHVLPKKFGGTNNSNNLVPSCLSCNQLKGDLLLTEFIVRHNIKITRQLSSFL